MELDGRGLESQTHEQTGLHSTSSLLFETTTLTVQFRAGPAPFPVPVLA